MKHNLLLLLAMTGFVGCNSTEPPAVASSEPDLPEETANFFIGYPETSESGGTGSGPATPYTMCDLIGAYESLLIVDVEDAKVFSQSRDCDEEPEFRTGYWSLTTDVITSLSTKIEAGSQQVLLRGGEFTYMPPRLGRLMVGVRESRGKLWITEAVSIATAPTSGQLTRVEDDRPYDYRLPGTYFELIDEYERIKADPKAACADAEDHSVWAKTKTMSQQAFDDYVNTPNPAGRAFCHPDYVPFTPDMGADAGQDAGR